MSQTFFPIQWAPLNSPAALAPTGNPTQFFTIAWRPMLCVVYYPRESLVPSEGLTYPSTASPKD